MPNVTTPREAIELAVKTEEVGGIFYRKIAERLSSNADISAIFTQLATDEEAHKVTFEKLMESVPKEFAYKSQRERLAVLRAIAMSEFFLSEDGVFRDLEKIKTTEDALRRALQLERETLAYYMAVRDALGEHEVVEAMIQAERLHLAQLLERLEG